LPNSSAQPRATVPSSVPVVMATSFAAGIGTAARENAVKSS
jgi:hypothetical protein